jgi:hypothetical protein
MIEAQTQREGLRVERRIFLWMLIAPSVIARIVLSSHELPNGLFDDAYVTLRYAENLMNGLGLVFNPGERVMGTTSPLLTFVLAAFGKIFGASHLELIALSVGILASAGTLYFCERSLRAAGLPAPVQWTFLAVVAFVPSFISNSTSGMETPLVLFLMSVSLYLFVGDRLIALSIVGFLLFLGRVDTSLWLLALAIELLLAHRRKGIGELIRPLMLFCGALFAWLIFLKMYFGRIVPQSVVGKAVSHGAFLLPDWDYVLTLLSAFVPAQRFGVWGLVLIVAVFAALIPSAIDLWRGFPKVRPVLYFFLLYVGVFLAARAPLFSWYLIPPKWAFYLIAVYAIWNVLSNARVRSVMPLKSSYVMALIGTLLFAAGVRAVAVRRANSEDSSSVAISKVIEESLPPAGTVFLEHIGLVGYRSGCYIYDSMGLVTPETTRLRKAYGSAWLPKAARQYHADIVILYDSDLPLMRSQRDQDAVWFQTNYSAVREYQLGYVLATIYFRNDSSLIRKAVAAP